MRRSIHSRGAVEAKACSRWIGTALVLGGASLGADAASAGLILKTYIGPASGSWNDGANWSPAGVPDNGVDAFEVLIDAVPRQSSTVSLSGIITIDSLQIDPGDALAISNAGQLRLAGPSIVNDGTISLLSSGGSTDLRIDASEVSLTGSGQILTSNSQLNRVTGLNGDRRLVIGAGQSLRGAFRLGDGNLRLTNAGLIENNASAGATIDLDDNFPGNFNHGTIRAANGAFMVILQTQIDNAGGVIEAAPGSRVTLTNSTVDGGILRDADGAGPGSIRMSGAFNELSDVSVEGPLRLNSGAVVRVEGSFDYDGPIQLMASGLLTDLEINITPFVVSGPGIECSEPWYNRISSSLDTVELTIARDSSMTGCFNTEGHVFLITNLGAMIARGDNLASIEPQTGVSTNEGVIAAEESAFLELDGFPGDVIWENTNGLIEARPTGTVRIRFCTIHGGLIRAVDDDEAPGVIVLVTQARLDGVAVEGRMVVTPEDHDIALLNQIDLAGSLILESTIDEPSCEINFVGAPFLLDGSGETMGHSAAHDRILGDSFVVGTDHTLHGSITIHPPMTILGELLADAPGGIVLAGAVTNQGLVQLSSAGIDSTGPSFVNQGTVEIPPDRTLSRTGSFVQTSGATTVDGTLMATTGVALEGGALKGNGLVAAGVTNSGGTISPGSSFGALTINGAFVQESDGTLDIEIGGLSQGIDHDALSVNGNATLGGTLVVTLENDFVPDAKDEFVILANTGSLTGEFEFVESPLPIEVVYGEHSVTISFPDRRQLVGDFNDDGVVDGDDLGTLLGYWGPCESEKCPADLNDDGVVDGDDLGTLLGNWS